MFATCVGTVDVAWLHFKRDSTILEWTVIWILAVDIAVAVDIAHVIPDGMFFWADGVFELQDACGFRLMITQIANLDRDATTPSPGINHFVDRMSAVCRDRNITLVAGGAMDKLVYLVEGWSSPVDRVWRRPW